MRWQNFFTLVALLLGVQPLWAAPGMEVRSADGRVVIDVEAERLAAWRPTPKGLIVVMPEGGPVVLGNLPAGVTAEALSNNGLQGVLVHGVEGSWRVVQDGPRWLIRPGNGLPSESVLMLRDGWYAAGETLSPRRFDALGKTWQVALTSRAMSLAGSVVGGVKAGETVGAAAKGEPVAEEGQAQAPSAVSLTPVAVSEMLVRSGAPDDAEAAAEATLPPALPAKPEVEAARARVESGLAKVEVFQAPSMKPLAVNAVTSEILPRALGEVYLPGTLVSLTLPDGMGGLGVPVVPAERSEDRPDVEQQEVRADTPPADEPVEVALPRVSSTWNQVTLQPAVEAQAAAAVQHEEQELRRKGLVSPTHVDMADVQEVEETKAAAGPQLVPERGASYVEDVQPALLGLTETEPGSTREHEARLYLAGLYLSWQRPEEALAALGSLPQRRDELPASAQGRLLMGLATLAQGGDVLPKMFDQGGALSPHARLWRAVAASRSGDYATALKLWPEERGILPEYPGYLREMAQQAQAAALVWVGDRNLAKTVLAQLVKGYSDPAAVPASLNRLQGLVRLGTPEEAEGLDYLARAAEDTRDPTTAHRAKFEFVRALHQRRDLSDAQVIAYLSDLWFDWRGDELEQDVLFMLGSLANAVGDSRRALHYWQTLVQAYPRATRLREVTERMGDAFVNVFDPENPRTYDPLEYIGLYYDFSELVPASYRGDLIHEQVARLMIDANLWPRAVPILEQQLKSRPLDKATQGRLSLMLAEAYGNMGKAAEGLKIIDTWQYAATTQVLAREWKLVEADLLLKLKRPEAVLKALASMPQDDPAVRNLTIEAAVMAQAWPTAITQLEAQLDDVTPAALAADRGAQVAAFRLGYVYGQTRQPAKLEELMRRYADAMPRVPQLADGLTAVAAGMGLNADISSVGPLAGLTGALNDLTRLTANVEEQRREVKRQEVEQQEYNDKMRYMELLPPPSI